MDALARAGKLRADQVIQAVQPKGGITLVQAQQPAFQFLILLPAQRRFAAQPFVVPAAGDLQQSAYKFHRGPRAAVRMYRYLSSMVWKVCRRIF